MRDRILKRFSIIGLTILVLGSIIGHYLWFNFIFKVNVPPKDANEVIQSLIGFYSSLFTAIAIILGIIAIIGWRWIKDELAEKEKRITDKAEGLEKKWSEKENELNKKFEVLDEKIKESSIFISEFKKVEDKVNFLEKRTKWAKWVRDKFDSPYGKVISLDFEYYDDEKETIKDIKERLTRDFIECGWLELIYAKEILSTANDEKHEEKYTKTFKILKNIIDRDMVDGLNTSLEGYVYHILGQLFWKYYYEKKKNDFIEFKEKKNYFNEWQKEQLKDIRKEKDEKFSLVSCLKESKKFYDKALKKKIEKNCKINETLGNIALVNTELAKLDEYKDKRDDILSEAEKYLKQILSINEATFDTYWDLARVYYYQKKSLSEIVKNLKNALKLIKRENEKITFFREIWQEFEETGFPDAEKGSEIIKELEDKN